MNKRILVGVPPKHHVLLSYDEINGLSQLGYTCRPVLYGQNNSSLNKITKVLGVIARAINIVKELYRFKPHILYLNSRFEPVATTRDFITAWVVNLLYIRKLKIVIKTHGSDVSILESPSFFYKHIVVPYLVKHIDAWFFLSNEEK